MLALVSKADHRAMSVVMVACLSGAGVVPALLNLRCSTQHGLCGSFSAPDFQPPRHLEGHFAQKNKSFSPTVITDATALYDSYHRNAINHGATDKRTNLDPRMVREQVEGMNGIFKWISSELQFGDVLFKIFACQFPCGHLTDGAFDPRYTASRRKLQHRDIRIGTSLRLPMPPPVSPHFHQSNHM